uniref:ATP synthase complex subunit 8 n=1 Tax=Neogeoscapheus hanni TaxID=1805786 RepID=A0A8K1HP17_9NEOP|nr:ATP synthase F0 subunit 8 [Neogeoscapheus hanni]
MPQMMPLSWTILYIYFIMILFMFVFMNYYSFIPLPKIKEKKTSFKPFDWKW